MLFARLPDCTCSSRTNMIQPPALSMPEMPIKRPIHRVRTNKMSFIVWSEVAELVECKNCCKKISHRTPGNLPHGWTLAYVFVTSKLRLIHPFKLIYLCSKTEEYCHTHLWTKNGLFFGIQQTVPCYSIFQIRGMMHVNYYIYVFNDFKKLVVGG